ncbi:hypothetical protein LZ32DRAFT_623581 [Colletotrichum eremochloae]|nr:hypothetical protein LZ32DRAFT_623581 [Colletotrichum eremochloae]
MFSILVVEGYFRDLKGKLSKIPLYIIKSYTLANKLLYPFIYLEDIEPITYIIKYLGLNKVYKSKQINKIKAIRTYKKGSKLGLSIIIYIRLYLTYNPYIAIYKNNIIDYNITYTTTLHFIYIRYKKALLSIIINFFKVGPLGRLTKRLTYSYSTITLSKPYDKATYYIVIYLFIGILGKEEKNL